MSDVKVSALCPLIFPSVDDPASLYAFISAF